jgi:ADP-heptose:LPS heptosyltransferase
VSIKKNRLLCIQPQGFGDQVMMLHSLSVLRKHYPEVVFVIVCSSKVSYELTSLWTANEDSLFLLNKKKLSSIVSLLLRIWRVKPYISYVVPYTNLFFGQLISFLSLSKIRIGERQTIPIIGFNRTPPQAEKDKKHKSYQHIALLRLYFKRLPKNPEFTELDYRGLPGSRMGRRTNRANSFVGIHPGCDSKSLYKRWPAEKFTELIQIILDKTDAEVFLFFGPDELDIMHMFKNNSSRVIECINQPIEGVLTALSRLSILLTTDSGLGHLASSVKIPTFSLTGPGDSNVTYPLLFKSHVIESQSTLDCRPCVHTKEYLHCKTRPCLSGISAETVFSRISHYL